MIVIDLRDAYHHHLPPPKEDSYWTPEYSYSGGYPLDWMLDCTPDYDDYDYDYGSDTGIGW
jgi:hypothetical protein